MRKGQAYSLYLCRLETMGDSEMRRDGNVSDPCGNKKPGEKHDP